MTEKGPRFPWGSIVFAILLSAQVLITELTGSNLTEIMAAIEGVVWTGVVCTLIVMVVRAALNGDSVKSERAFRLLRMARDRPESMHPKSHHTRLPRQRRVSHEAEQGGHPSDRRSGAPLHSATTSVQRNNDACRRAQSPQDREQPADAAQRDNNDTSSAT
jgi:hypothetical protein